VYSLACYEETLLVGSNQGFVKMLDVHGMANDTDTIAPRQIAQYVPPGSNVSSGLFENFSSAIKSKHQLSRRFI
jgi:hypothetical protein